VVVDTCNPSTREDYMRPAWLHSDAWSQRKKKVWQESSNCIY
jgi:hypothetical protein